MITPQNGVAVTGMSKVIFISTIIATIVISVVQSRDLRPSEHGLPFQNLPPRSPEMITFFGDSDSPSTSQVILGNSSDTTAAGSDSWWRETPGKARESRVRKALVVATVVCGGTGVVLLLAAAFLFAVHFYKRRLLAASSSSSSANRINSSRSAAVTVINNNTADPHKLNQVMI